MFTFFSFYKNGELFRDIFFHLSRRLGHSFSTHVGSCGRHVFWFSFFLFCAFFGVFLQKSLFFSLSLKSLQFTMLCQGIGQKCKLNGLECILGSIYIPPPPPPYNAEVLRVVASLMYEYLDTPFLILGDFNNVLNPSIDCHPAGTQFDTPFSQQICKLGLYDIWRMQNPSDQQFLCCFSTYRSLTRIDQVLGMDTVLPYVTPSSYHARGLSDHSLMEVNLLLTEQFNHFPWKILFSLA